MGYNEASKFISRIVLGSIIAIWLGPKLDNLFNLCLVDWDNNEQAKLFDITEDNCKYIGGNAIMWLFDLKNTFY